MVQQYRSLWIWIVCLVFFWSSTVFAQASFQGLGTLSGGFSRAYRISDDGSTPVGESDGQAFYWTSVSGMVGIGGTRAFDASADGSVIVGDSNRRAFRWKQAGGLVLIGGSDTRAHGVSPDGSIVVGSSGQAAAGGRQAWRWTSTTVLVNFLNITQVAPYKLM